MRRPRLRRPAAGLAAAILTATWAGAQIDYSAYHTPEDCDALLEARPRDVAASTCYRMLARRVQSWEAVVRHLEARLGRKPGNLYVRYALARVEADMFTERAEPLLREAADGFRAAGDAQGEVWAALDLCFALSEQHRLAEAAAELERADAVAAAAGDRVLQLLVLHHRGLMASARGDTARSLSLLKEVEAEAFPHGPWFLQAIVSNALGNEYRRRGRAGEALQQYLRAASIQARVGDHYFEALTRGNILDLLPDLRAAGLVTKAEEAGLVEETMRAAARGANKVVEADEYHRRGSEEGRSPEEARSLLRRSADIALEIRDPYRAARTIRWLARLEVQRGTRGTEEALRLTEEAIGLSRSSGSLEQEAYGLLSKAWVLDRAGRREESVAAWLEALDVIEKLRDLQRDDAVSARFMASWAFTYYRLANYVLEPEGADRSSEAMEMAFSIVERLRARALLDAMDAAGAARAGEAGGPERSRRDDLLTRIARTQRRLLSPVLPEAERRAALADLDRQEADEEALRASIAAADPAFADLRAPRLATLEEVRASLRPEEAMLSYCFGPGEETAGRVFVVAPDRVRAVRLPPGAALAGSASLLLGLMERRDASEAPGAARLHRDLVAPALAELPEGVSHLIVVPDGVTHRLPLEVLRGGDGPAPVAARYQISYAPSASMWWKWRRSPPSPAPAAVLALADPDPPGTPGEGSALIARGPRLGRLPHARREAASVSRLLGGGRPLTGSEASERYFKTSAVGSFGVLHIAAHALVDDERPERSAIVLAPGAEGEDGLLQIRDLAGLRLEDNLVVLSACRSASGAAVEGSGVFGLARGFFRAGARAVVGGLWPMRDDEAASMMEAFARRLSEGKSVAGALASARMEKMAAGAPAAAWAGFVVLGDGSLVPFPGGLEGRSPAAAALVLLTALLAAAALLLLRRLRAR